MCPFVPPDYQPSTSLMLTSLFWIHVLFFGSPPKVFTYPQARAPDMGGGFHGQSSCSYGLFSLARRGEGTACFFKLPSHFAECHYFPWETKPTKRWRPNWPFREALSSCILAQTIIHYHFFEFYCLIRVPESLSSLNFHMESPFKWSSQLDFLKDTPHGLLTFEWKRLKEIGSTGHFDCFLEQESLTWGPWVP